MDWTNPFATNDTTKLYLDEAQKFWIEVRNEIDHAEQRAISLGSFRRVYREDETLMELDPRAGADQKVVTYLVDWNLTRQEGGKTVPIDISTEALKRDAVKHLKHENYKAIEERIDAHVLACQSKKAASGETKSAPTSA